VRATDLAAIVEHRHRPGIVRRFFSALGPGLVTGAADDDPSGVTTYAIAGAQMGTALLWTAFITWPLMAAVQFMCAQIGMATGKGLADALGRKTPCWLLFGGAFALMGANTMNVGADLSGMADAAAILTGINSHIYVVMFRRGHRSCRPAISLPSISGDSEMAERGPICLHHCCVCQRP
jgi:Mn2+/Fe2+ NRAMP family transporter